MERISIQEIAAVLVTKNGLKKKEAERFVTVLFDLVKDGLESERLVKVKGLGTFKIIDIEARESVNVNTGERVMIEGHDKITFTPDVAMKELVNKPFSQFETVILNDGVEFDDVDTNASESMEESEDILIEEPVVEEAEEPVVEEAEKPVVEETEEPVVEEAEEPVVEETEEPVEEQSDLENEPPILEFIENQEEIESNDLPEQTDDEEMEMTKRKTGRNIIWILVAVAACIASFAAGYYVGKASGYDAGENLEIAESIDYKEESDSADVVKLKGDSIADASKKDSAVVAVKKDSAVVAVKKDTAVVAVKEDTVVAAANVAAAKKDAVVTAAKKEVTTVSSSETVDKYAKMDARVRTGAYRIVGNDYEVKVKAGETLKRIAQRTLGPDMECYIEVFNGINDNTELKAGQSLRIPKLELKKKKKSTNQ